MVDAQRASGGQFGWGGVNKGAGAEREEAGKADHAELVGDDEDVDLADKGDKHAGPRNRMDKVCVLCNVKLSTGVPDLYSLSVNLSSVLHLAGEDVSFHHDLGGIQPGPPDTGPSRAVQILKHLRGNFSNHSLLQQDSMLIGYPIKASPKIFGKDYGSDNQKLGL